MITKIPREFTDQFNEIVRRRRLSKRVVATAFAVSVQAVERWLKGESQPHPALHERFFETLEEL